MASWIFVLLATIGGEQGGSGPTAIATANADGSRAAATVERGFHAYQQQISDLLKRESQAREPAARLVEHFFRHEAGRLVSQRFLQVIACGGKFH